MSGTSSVPSKVSSVWLGELDLKIWKPWMLLHREVSVSPCNNKLYVCIASAYAGSLELMLASVRGWVYRQLESSSIKSRWIIILFYPVQLSFCDAIQRNNLPPCFPYSSTGNDPVGDQTIVWLPLVFGKLPLIFPALHRHSDCQPGKPGKLSNRRVGFCFSSVLHSSCILSLKKKKSIHGLLPCSESIATTTGQSKFRLLCTFCSFQKFS